MGTGISHLISQALIESNGSPSLPAKLQQIDDLFFVPIYKQSAMS